MKTEKQIISLQLPTVLANKIKSEAEESYMTTSAFIRKLLIEYYKEKIDGDKLN